MSRRSDGRYDIGEVVTVSDGGSDDDRTRTYDGFVLLSSGTKTIVVQFDPEPPVDTFEVACEMARRLLQPGGALWTRIHATIAPATP